MSQASPVLVCDECSSTFFYTVRSEQFQSGGYGSAEFRSISNAPKTLLICLCGKPYTPKSSYFAKSTVAAAQEEAFRKSVEAAQKYLKEHSLEHVASIAASPAEIQALEDRIREITKNLESIRSSILIQEDKKVKTRGDKHAKPTQSTSS